MNGLATGILLCERFPHTKTSIIAELTGDETTSRGAGGLWKPFSLGVQVAVGCHWFQPHFRGLELPSDYTQVIHLQPMLTDGVKLRSSIC